MAKVCFYTGRPLLFGLDPSKNYPPRSLIDRFSFINFTFIFIFKGYRTTVSDRAQTGRFHFYLQAFETKITAKLFEIQEFF